MQKIVLIELGKTKDAWIREGEGEYLKRLQRYAHVEKKNLSDESIKSSKTLEQIKQIERKKIEKALPPNFCCVVLDVKGKQFSSEEFADFIGKRSDEGRNIVFVIGSAHGLAKEVRQKADVCLSFSKMTFTHQMIRVVLLEQIFRAYSILAGTGYHK